MLASFRDHDRLRLVDDRSMINDEDFACLDESMGRSDRANKLIGMVPWRRTGEHSSSASANLFPCSSGDMTPTRNTNVGSSTICAVEELQIPSDFGAKVPMDFTQTHGKIINDPQEVDALLKEEQWRAKDQIRLHSPDNRIPHLSSYVVQPWYHGSISRDEAVAMICRHGCKEGTFLVRLSSSLAGCFVLSLAFGNSVLHYPIAQVKDSGDKRVSLDGGKTKFIDLLQLIEFYQVNTGSYLPTTLRRFVTRAIDVPRYANPGAPRSSF